MENKDIDLRFGERVRELRQERKVGLRDFAKQVEVSATYLSQIERGQTKPTEERVFAIARALGEDEIEMLALSGHIAKDIQDLLLESPRQRSALLLATQHLTKGQIEELVSIASHMPKRRRKVRRSSDDRS